jgi:hypothetical protein
VAFAIWAKPGKAAHLHKMRAAIEAKSPNDYSAGKNAAEFVLGQRGRRVFENAGDKKQGLNPLRSESRN